MTFSYRIDLSVDSFELWTAKVYEGDSLIWDGNIDGFPHYPDREVVAAIVLAAAAKYHLNDEDDYVRDSIIHNMDVAIGPEENQDDDFEDEDDNE